MQRRMLRSQKACTSLKSCNSKAGSGFSPRSLQKVSENKNVHAFMIFIFIFFPRWGRYLEWRSRRGGGKRWSSSTGETFQSAATLYCCWCNLMKLRICSIVHIRHSFTMKVRADAKVLLPWIVILISDFIIVMQLNRDKLEILGFGRYNVDWVNVVMVGKR